jgi:hypothetical protein
VFAWIKGKQFAPPTPPLVDYWVTAQVTLREAVPFGDQVAGAYIRSLGIRCEPLHLRSLIEATADDGSVVWNGEDTYWAPVVLNDLSRDLRRRINPGDHECVWHKSGRIYFPAP